MIKKTIATALALCSFLLRGIFPLGSQERLEGTFQIDCQQILFENMLDKSFEQSAGRKRESPTREEQDVIDRSIKLMLEEARWVFSGMIYGFRFTYVPQDKGTGVEENFILEPLHQIPWGDKSLKARDIQFLWPRLTVTFDYPMTVSQKDRLDGWTSSVFLSSGGLGGVALQQDNCLIGASEQAVKEALREYLRKVEYNKPRKVTGVVSLRSVPVHGYSSGQCLSTVKIKMRIDKIKDYAHP